jgi:signal transduction histidine kinase/ActR/RegA family two-component response regulator
LQFLVTAGVFGLVALALAIAWRRARQRVIQLQRREQRLDNRLLELTNQLKQAHRMEAVGILAGSIANNLNNLLAVILGHTRIATDVVRDPAALMDELDKVMQAGHVASDLVKEISDFYLQADQVRKPTDLGPVVNDTLKLIRDILPSSIELKTDLKRCGPVLASVTGIQQILMNLCSNSMHAMYRGSGVIDVTLKEEKISSRKAATPRDLPVGSYVKLSVKDDGRGMNKETLDRIFESYVSNAADGSKMGIGLSTVSRILEEHRGATLVHSQVGRGTTVDIYLPLIAWQVEDPVGPEIAKQEVVRELSSRLPRHSHAENEPLVLPVAQAADDTADQVAATVLLVDDEEMVAQVMVRGLQRMGYRVVMHTDSRTALADFSETPAVFDVVVTDQIMPHMSGVRLTRKIHEIRSDIPVVLFTGFRDSFNEEQAREAGVTEFLLKPSSHRDLADLIRRLMLRKMSGRG